MAARPARAAHLQPVPDDDGLDDAEVDEDYGGIDDISVRFTGALAKLGFSTRGELQVTLAVDDRSPVTNVELMRLRHRIIAITLEPRDSRGRPTNPGVDPIKARVTAERLDRMMGGWVDAKAPWSLADEWVDEADDDGRMDW